MAVNNRAIKFVSGILVGAGLILLGLNLFTGIEVNAALPLVILMLGLAFYSLVPFLSRRWLGAGWLYLPGSLLLALGLIFLINVITNDLNSWAYAWFLLISGLGVGFSLATWQMRWTQSFVLAGVIAAVSGVALFALFGAIAGGPFIQVMAPLLLVLAGLGLFLFKPKLHLIDPLLWRSLRNSAADKTADGEMNPASLDNKPYAGISLTSGQEPVSAAQPALVEPLSARELQVLRLIDQGLTNAEIATRLTLAPSTVKTHINNIYGKLEVENRVQALKRARELDLLNF